MRHHHNKCYIVMQKHIVDERIFIIMIDILMFRDIITILWQ